jgi:hypothetical protein
MPTTVDFPADLLNTSSSCTNTNRNNNNELAYWLLLINALWDYACALAVHADTFLARPSWVANAHLDLWCDAADRDNTGSRLLFEGLLIQWGFMRSLSAATGDPVLGLLSYGAEAFCVALCAVQGRMHAGRAAVVILLSAACALVLLLRFETTTMLLLPPPAKPHLLLPPPH